MTLPLYRGGKSSETEIIAGPESHHRPPKATEILLPCRDARREVYDPDSDFLSCFRQGVFFGLSGNLIGLNRNHNCLIKGIGFFPAKRYWEKPSRRNGTHTGRKASVRDYERDLQADSLFVRLVSAMERTLFSFSRRARV